MIVGMNDAGQQLLDAVRATSAAVTDAIDATHQAMRQTAQATSAARKARADAIAAADDAGVPRELIAAAAGLQWPMTRQRWSQLRQQSKETK